MRTEEWLRFEHELQILSTGTNYENQGYKLSRNSISIIQAGPVGESWAATLQQCKFSMLKTLNSVQPTTILSHCVVIPIKIMRKLYSSISHNIKLPA